MADLRAFSGLRYDAGRTDGLERVISPPYDVIPEDQLETYRQRSPYNVIRLIRPGTDYESAGRLLQEWQRDGVLRSDEPSMYLHEIRWDGRVRRDLVAALRLQPYEDRVVLPHERTHRGPKEDRLALFRATGYSLEPLWFLYDGASSELPGLLHEGFRRAADVEFEFPAGHAHRLWRVGDERWIAGVRASLADQPVLIADGHHRYETTLAYSQEIGGAEDAASRFTLALLTDLNDPGVVVLPTHRILKAGVAVTGGEEAGSLDEVLGALDGRMAAGVYRGGHFQVIELEGEVAVVELHRQVIDNILGQRNPEEYLSYTRDPREAVAAVDSGQAVAAFFLGPPNLRVVLEKAREGMTMPQKTTFFDPKPPSGMVFHHLDPATTLQE
jgi:uncharacterized protein (DUF1015 family)